MGNWEFRGNGDNYAEAVDALEKNYSENHWTELEPTGSCDDNGTLQRFEARDLDGSLLYFIDLNFEDEIYDRTQWKDGERSYYLYDVIVRKWVIIEGDDRERGYERTHFDTAKDAAEHLHYRLRQWSSDRFNVFGSI